MSGPPTDTEEGREDPKSKQSSQTEFHNYLDLRKEADKPLNERKHVTAKRDGTGAAPRRYHLDAEKKEKLKSQSQATGGIINPMESKRGAYWAQIEALIHLGTDQWHRLNDVRDKMQEIMSEIPKIKKIGGEKNQTNAWDDFANKRKREGADAPKDVRARIEQNMRVLQRLPKPTRKEKNPYGLKLAQFGMTVDIEYVEEQDGLPPIPYYMLNTQWAEDENGMTVEPYYYYPRRRGRKKSTSQQPESSENQQDQNESSKANDSPESHNESEINCETSDDQSEAEDDQQQESKYTNSYVESEESVDFQTIYLDTENGSDEYDGLSPETAVQSLEQLQQISIVYDRVEIRDADDNLLPNDLLNGEDWDADFVEVANGESRESSEDENDYYEEEEG